MTARKYAVSFVHLKPPHRQNPLVESRDFRDRLCAWFDEYGREHPWRLTTDPWAILVAEIMLQQTTVAAVRAGRRFEKFLQTFPDIESINRASEVELLKAWEGLGYYNRVRNLQRTAQAVLTDWQGQFPRCAEQLETLPGVGPYTAGAVASFAFNEPAPIVDGNIARVLTRLLDSAIEIDSTSGKKELWAWARDLLDSERSRIFNSALMEVGQVFCRSKNPDCLSCPISSFCKTVEPETLPCKKEKPKPELVTEHALVIEQAGKFLLTREEGTRRKGFYRLPLREADEVADLELLLTRKYAITKYRVTLHLYQSPISETLRENEVWVTSAEVAALPIPSPIRRAFEAALLVKKKR